jgi:hypothetical protein
MKPATVLTVLAPRYDRFFIRTGAISDELPCE